jgi:hypothetical protein
MLSFRENTFGRILEVPIMEEHDMFVEKTVKETERNEHEKFLRLAIKVSPARVDLVTETNPRVF